MKNPLSNEAFADWCEKQGDRKYDYADNKGCACYQYLKWLGMPVRSVDDRAWFDMDCIDHELPPGWNEAVIGCPRTFSALAVRLREAMP